MGNLPVAIFSPKNDFPSSHSFLLPNNMRLGLETICPIYAEIFVGLVLYRSCSGSHSWCAFTIAIGIPCPEDRISYTQPHPLFLTLFLPPIPWGSPTLMGADNMMCFLALSTDSFILGIVTCSASLHCFLPTVQRSFYDQCWEQPRSMGISINI